MSDTYTLAGMKAMVESVDALIQRALGDRGLSRREMTEEELRKVMQRAGMTEETFALYSFNRTRVAELESSRKVELRTKGEQRRSDMPDALTAAIAQQTAANAARESQPGRYDGVAIKDLARKIEMEHQAIAAWRAANDVEPAVDPEARLRAVAAGNPKAAAAFGLLNAGAPVIVPLDESGRLLTQPARDPDVIASWFEPDGPYVDKWPAIPCGPEGGVFGLLCYPGEGMDWFRQAATVHRPSRVERLMAAVTDRITEMGVPPSGGGSWDDDDESPAQPDELRAPMSARLWLVEDLPAHRAVTRTWTGPIRGREGQAAMAAAIPPQPKQLSAHVWSWPAGQTLPVGRELRKGVESLAAIPALGTVITVGGVRFVVRQVPSLLSSPPDWLIDAVKM